MDLVNNNVPVIVGEKVAGESAKVRKELEKTLKLSSCSMFDIADLCYKIKKNSLYEGFVTFNKFLESLNFKYSRLRYLTRMAEVMDIVGIPRTKYEPLGLSKLRSITSLDPEKTWVNPDTQEETPISAFIKGFVEKGADMPLTEIDQHVRTLKGLVGAEAMGWMHLYMKQLAIEQVARPALDLAKAKIGSVGKDEEGNSKDATDGAAAEAIFAAFLSDPSNEMELLSDIPDNQPDVVGS